MEISPSVGHTHWQRTDHRKRDEGVVRHKDPRGHNHEQVDMGRQEADGLREVEVVNDSLRDGSSSHHVEGANAGDNHHDEGYSHVVEAAHGHSIHQRVDSHLDEMGVGIGNGSDRCVELHLESIESQHKSFRELLKVTYISLTADVGAFEFLIVQLFHGYFQVTGSLKFHETRHVSAGNYRRVHVRLTLCHHDRDRPLNRRRRDSTDVQNLSNPRVPK